MADKIKVGLVGIGNIGSLHLEMYSLIEDCEVFAIDADPSKKQQADLFGVPFFTSLDEAIKKVNFDIFDICLPTHLHYEYAKKIIHETHAHLIIEKPLFQTSQQAIEIENNIIGTNRVIMCAMVERFFEPFKIIKNWCDNVGGPFEMEFTRRTKPQREEWFSDEAKGGNLVLDLGIHDIDLMHWFTGAKDEEVQSSIASQRADIVIKTTDESISKFYVGWDLPENSSVGILNEIRIKSGNREISFSSEKNSLIIDGIDVAVTEDRIPFAYKGELEHALSCVRYSCTPIISLHDSIVALKTIERINDVRSPAILKTTRLAIDGGRPVRDVMPTPVSPYGREEMEAVTRVMQSGTVSSFRGGKEVRAFEEEFADFIGVQFAVATTNGTSALHSALSALNLPADEEIEVAVPALTFVSTASVVLQERLKPIFIDIDPYFCIDPKDLKDKITDKTKAIIPVHLYGQPCDMDTIIDIARERGIAVIEDSAQAHGAMYGEKKAGSIGNMGCFSMFEFKNMGTGEGGMVTVDDEALYREIRLVREHGSPADSDSWYNYVRLGYNYNMTELQAAIGREQLKKLPDKNERRAENAFNYETSLKNLGLNLPVYRSSVKSAHHLFPILLPESMNKLRDYFVKAVQAEGIPLGVAYPHPLYKTALFKNMGDTSHCPVTENITARIVTLFTDPGVDQSLITDTARAIEKVLSHMSPKL